MTSTASLPEDEDVAGRAIGYTSFGGNCAHPNTDTLRYRGTCACGGYSTVEDLQRFASALTNHKLLNAEYTELLTTGKVETPGGGRYAFGFSDQGADCGARHFGHGGGAPGMNGDLQIYPQSGYVIAVLSNLDPPAASRVSGSSPTVCPKTERESTPGLWTGVAWSSPTFTICLSPRSAVIAMRKSTITVAPWWPGSWLAPL